MTFQIVRAIYSLLFIFGLPVILLRLIMKSVKLPAYRSRWRERFGCPSLSLTSSIWVHAVSVGEAISAVPFVRQIQKQFPALPIVVTTMTPTGSDRVKAAFSKELNQTIFHSYVPYDIPFALQAFIKRVNPMALILMETEIWPNLITVCHDYHIPMMIANARLSPKSLKQYKMGRAIVKPLMEKITYVGAQSAMDSERFIEIGTPTETVQTVGNIKFDMSWPPEVIQKGKALRHQLGTHRQIWIAASTHEGEEAIVLQAYHQLKSQFSDLLLLLVPRHPERFQKVAQLCETANLKIVKHTENIPCSNETDVFLGDTMGEMGTFYAASNVVFVGGSFAPIGGHNLLEPAALSLPILTGPHLHNFVYISEVLLAAGGATLVQNQDELVECIANLLRDPKWAHVQGQRAQTVVEENKGALERLMKLVCKLLATH
ncbi:MAG: lipid IV(A) 3-deoxy-D-manno-octulosonic acid transferase [Gammaproteobacteria bacterium]